jgi:hypothetical protein
VITGGWQVRVQVQAPEVSGDTVVFRWEQSEPNPYQRQNAFFFRYEGIDLAAFSTTLLLEVFLGLQIKVFAAYEQPVEVVFPEPVPYTTAAYWTAFHHADNVTIAPLDPSPRYSPWASAPRPAYPPRKTAVFFGGGRDSSLVASLLRELSSPEQVLLVQYVAPLQPSPALAQRLERRQEHLMLRPWRERMSVATQRVWTDYQEIFLPAGRFQRPHLELYTLGALPALLSRGVSVASFCHAWTDYSIARTSRGVTRFERGGSRPELLRTQSAHYRAVLGEDLTVTNLELPFSSFSAVRILAGRYRQALGQMVMCTRGGAEERWCYNCWKCVWHAIYGLAASFVDPELDYDRLFASSTYMRRVVAFAASGVELLPSGNAPWQCFMRIDYLHGVHEHALAVLDLNTPAKLLGRLARANILTLKALFGNRAYPVLESLSRQAVELLGSDLARAMIELGAEHVPVVDKVTGPFPEGIHFDFDVRMPTRTGELEHIRKAMER